MDAIGWEVPVPLSVIIVSSFGYENVLGCQRSRFAVYPRGFIDGLFVPCIYCEQRGFGDF